MLWLFGLGGLLGSIHHAHSSPFTHQLAEHMKHLEWEGLHVWDLMMPLFLFITGYSMVFSFEKRLQTQSKTAIYCHTLKRVIILWLLGMVVQGNLLDFKWDRLMFS